MRKALTLGHRTETLDYAILLSGECDLELDSGEVAYLKPGDGAVQRGTMHAWVNHGPAPCVFAFILIDGNPAHDARWMVEFTEVANYFAFLSGMVNPFEVPAPLDGDKLPTWPSSLTLPGSPPPFPPQLAAAREG